MANLIIIKPVYIDKKLTMTLRDISFSLARGLRR